MRSDATASPAMECGICWWVYEPEQGDDARSVDPGTPFGSLPADWHCPRCDAPKAKFLPVDAELREPVTQLRRAYEQIWATQMRELDVANPQLEVEALDFQPLPIGLMGVLVTPWMMSVVVVPASHLRLEVPIGSTVQLELPNGTYTFTVAEVADVGRVANLSVLSPMDQVGSQDDARALAVQILGELRRPSGATSGADRRAFLRGEWR